MLHRLDSDCVCCFSCWKRLLRKTSNMPYNQNYQIKKLTRTLCKSHLSIFPFNVPSSVLVWMFISSTERRFVGHQWNALQFCYSYSMHVARQLCQKKKKNHTLFDWYTTSCCKPSSPQQKLSHWDHRCHGCGPFKQLIVFPGKIMFAYRLKKWVSESLK